MAIIPNKKVFTTFTSTGTATPSVKYNGTYNAGTTIIIAYGNWAKTFTYLNAVADTAGNTYSTFWVAATSSYSIAIAVCRLKATVTSATTINFTLSAAHSCKFMGYSVTGAQQARAGQIATSGSSGEARIAITPTATPTTLFCAVNYGTLSFATNPTAYPSGATLIEFNDNDDAVGPSLGLVMQSVTGTTSKTIGFTSGLTGFDYTIAAIALPEQKVLSGQTITMF